MTSYEPCVPRTASAVLAIVMTASTFGALVLLPYAMERESPYPSTTAVSTVASEHGSITDAPAGERAQSQAANQPETSALRRKHGRSHT